MPYIAKPAKERLDRGATPATLGELTYCITKHMITLDPERFMYSAVDGEVLAYLAHKNVSYADLAGVVGSLECARREYKRRRPDSYILVDGVLHDYIRHFYDTVVAPYEDLKIQQNGDVFA